MTNFQISCILNIGILLWITTSFVSTEQTPCIEKDFGYGSFVCVCNTTYCDTLPSVPSLDSGRVFVVTSDKKSKRWVTQYATLLIKDNEFDSLEDDINVTVTINGSTKFQKIIGFGGAFTDATGVNLYHVPEALQEYAIRGYYGAEGLEYGLGRVPIAGTDFSEYPYSYDDLPPGQTDPDLKYFALKKEDLKYKIPFIKKALEYGSARGVNIKLFASPWSSPAWMKTRQRINGDGRLKKKFYSSYANYIIRFLKEYEKQGLNFWAITTQNEPSAGLFFYHRFNELAWTPEDQGIWIGENLGPQMQAAGKGDVKIFILDDQRLYLPNWVIKLLENGNSSRFVYGVAVHWYTDFLTPPKVLDLTHEYYPHLPILYTEACTGSEIWDILKVVPGSWVRAERYAKNILQNLQHYVVGWTDWNLALNLEGGPNWVKNFVDSPLLVNQFEKEIYRQPMFYALGHFSKIFPEGSVRIGHSVAGNNEKDIDLVAFLRPDGSKAITILNTNYFPLTVKIEDENKYLILKMDERSIVSIVWNIG